MHYGDYIRVVVSWVPSLGKHNGECTGIMYDRPLVLFTLRPGIEVDMSIYTRMGIIKI